MRSKIESVGYEIPKYELKTEEQEILIKMSNDICTSMDIEIIMALTNCNITVFRDKLNPEVLENIGGYYPNFKEAARWMRHKGITNLNNDTDFILFKLRFG